MQVVEETYVGSPKTSTSTSVWGMTESVRKYLAI